MVGVKLPCGLIRDKILSYASSQLEKIGKEHIPKLVSITDTNDISANIYERQIAKTCKSVGLDYARRSQNFRDWSGVYHLIKRLNTLPTVHAIATCLPSSAVNSRNHSKLVNQIIIWKDVEGLNFYNEYFLSNGDLRDIMVPCSAAAVLSIIESFGWSVQEKKIVIVGGGFTTQRPIKGLLKRLHADLIHINQLSVNYWDDLRAADIIIFCDSNNCTLDKLAIKSGAALIDFGQEYSSASEESNARLEDLKEKLLWYVNEPDGVGVITTAWLCQNAIECYLRTQQGIVTPFDQQFNSIMGEEPINFSRFIIPVF